MSDKTLLQRRIEQRDAAIDDLLQRADTLRHCRDGKFSDINGRVGDVATMTVEADRLAGLVQELEDVEKYGPSGGR